MFLPIDGQHGFLEDKKTPNRLQLESTGPECRILFLKHSATKEPASRRFAVSRFLPKDLPSLAAFFTDVCCVWPGLGSLNLSTTSLYRLLLLLLFDRLTCEPES